MAAASTQTGQSGRHGGSARRRKPIHAVRTRRYTSGGYASGTLVKISPRLKNQSEAENETRTSRSKLRSDSGLRRSASPSRKTAQRPNHTATESSTLPPNAPDPPRAIFQAT